eukprot:CAMPEP_0197074550 /NCGR_PEP_ID=MMETSP1384-20130603/211158_1 /TAXON_ID=29189 /ORGANISM="Ammonia sp." /LENGTH=1272 /DNA_ID=CAMNT_0042513391 /DNA_START=43 /DNA_END=3862 /DNA_ORIENTATION=-
MSTCGRMEIDEDCNSTKNMAQTPNPNGSSAIANPCNTNSMQIDSRPQASPVHHKPVETSSSESSKECNKENLTIHNFFASAKKRKKRAREEMETDDTESTHNNASTSTSTSTVLPSTASSAIKKRKIATASSSKSLPIEQMPQKWEDKYKEYTKVITENFHSLHDEYSKVSACQSSLFQSEETQNELKQLQEQWLLFAKANEDANIKEFFIKEHLPLISKLVYARNEGLTDLSSAICNVLLSNLPTECSPSLSATAVRELILNSSERKILASNPAAKLSTDLSSAIRNVLLSNLPTECSPLLSAAAVRELILNSSERKIFGIKPSSKAISKEEEKVVALTDVDHDENQNSNNNDNHNHNNQHASSLNWNECRIYIWEPMNAQDIAAEYQMDLSPLKCLHSLLNKYGAFCKKYETLSAKRTMAMAEKEKNLQKIDDEIVSWLSKQQKAEQQRLRKEEEQRKKKEAREKALKEKEEMKRLKKEKAEQRQKEKEEKAKKEKERKEKLEKERLEKQQQKKEAAKTPKTAPNVLKTKTKRKASSIFMAKWIQATTPSNTDTNHNKTKSRSISQSIDCSISLSPSSSPNKNSNQQHTPYERRFTRFDCPPDCVMAPVHKYHDDEEEHIHIDLETRKITVSENIRPPKPTAIPKVVLDLSKLQNNDKEDENVGDNNNEHDAENPIDLTLENDLSRMQIDHDADDNEDDDISMHGHNNKHSKTLRYKYRCFQEDYRPQFFGVNKHKTSELEINIKKLCRSPLMRLSVNTNVVNYDSEDSGIEWYGDIDDLEGEDIDDDDEDEEAEMEEIEHQQQRGLLRGDGYENDKWLINSDDDDDEEALNDRDLMQNRERYRRLHDELKDEYPIRFTDQRQRGDAEDVPIVVRPQFFGVNKHQTSELEIDIKKLCRSPLMRLSVNTNVVNYDSEDSGIEWYGDIDDLEGEDIDDDDEDEEAEMEEIEHQQQRGLLRGDGYENDKWLINSDDEDDEEALNDRDLMQNRERYRRLHDELKDEYPIRFADQRQRGDAEDVPIVVRLPTIRDMQQQNGVLYALAVKKTMLFMEAEDDLVPVEHDEVKENDIAFRFTDQRQRGDAEDVPIVVRLPTIRDMQQQNGVLYALAVKKTMLFMEEEDDLVPVEHDEVKENDIAYLLELENKENESEDGKNKSKEDKKKEKKKSKKKKKKKEKEQDGKSHGKMECDHDEEEKNDDGADGENEHMDTKAKAKTPKISKQNTLTHYFSASKKEKEQKKEEEVEKKETDEVVHNVQQKKKAKRKVVCELVD